MQRFILVLVATCCSQIFYAQETNIQPGIALSDQSISFIESRYSKLTSLLQNQSAKMLRRMQKKEARLKKRLSKSDSALSNEIFNSGEEKYKDLQSSLNAKMDSSTGLSVQQEYIPGIDSMQTAIAFLKSGTGFEKLLPAQLQKLDLASGQLKELQAKLQAANNIQAFIRQRQQEFKERIKGQLLNNGIAKQLQGINKEAFYYEQRLREYKDLIRDQQKLEQRVLEVVRNMPLFKTFWQKNSYLASLFPASQSYGTQQALDGLQTVASIKQELQQKFGISNITTDASGAGDNYLQQQMQQAKNQLGALKEKLNNIGIKGGGANDVTMPDFKPNTQHTKTFLERLEYGFNIQSQKNSYLMPVTTDIAITAGYKISDKSAIGIGGAYRMGWGEGIKHIHLSHEGVGLRSYLEIKTKRNIWISGGYEMNYTKSFQQFAELHDLAKWQPSGLIGIVKKYKVGKHENNAQLLWDFLSYNQYPRTSPIKFRIGYKF